MSFLETKALSIAFNSSPWCRLYQTVLIFLVLKIWYFFTDDEEEIKQLREEVGKLRRELKDLRGKLQTDLASRLLSRVSRACPCTPELHEKISSVMIKQIKIVHNNLMD